MVPSRAFSPTSWTRRFALSPHAGHRMATARVLLLLSALRRVEWLVLLQRQTDSAGLVVARTLLAASVYVAFVATCGAWISRPRAADVFVSGTSGGRKRCCRGSDAFATKVTCAPTILLLAFVTAMSTLSFYAVLRIDNSVFAGKTQADYAHFRL